MIGIKGKTFQLVTTQLVVRKTSMVSLLHRHIFKEILLTTILAIGLFVFVLLVGNALRDITEIVAAGKLGAGVLFRLIGLLVPYVASYALPLGMLTGTLIAIGRLSSQREITAMKSAGVSLYQISSSVFVISFLFMTIGIVLNLHYAPQSRLAYKQLMANTVTENPVDFIQERRFIHDFPGYVIYMGDRDEEVMRDFWIWELDDQKRVQLFLRAARGELDYVESERKLVLTLYDGTGERRNADNIESLKDNTPDSPFFGKLPIALPLDQLFGEVSQRRARTKEMTLAQLLERRKGLIEQEQAKGQTEISEGRMKIQMHIQKNAAMAYSVFSLAIFGVPLAIRVGRKESYANLAVALVIAMIYYFLVIATSWFEEQPKLRPDLLVWIPNILFLTIGFLLLRRSNRN